MKKVAVIGAGPSGITAIKNLKDKGFDVIGFERCGGVGGNWRYDDPSGSWIALASGYGMVGVVRDSDNGVPTFYSDLQSALDTCKTVESYNTVTLYSNHTTTTGIIIDNTFPKYIRENIEKLSDFIEN